MGIKYRLRVHWTMGDIILYALLWLLLIGITLGIAAFFAPYAWAAKILNGCEVYDRNRQVVGVLKVDLSMSDRIVHIILWILLTLITFGIAAPIYYFGVARTVIDNTQIVDAFHA